MRWLLLSIIVVVVLVIVSLYVYARASPYKVSATDAKAMIQRGEIDVVLDVRTDAERNTLGFYPGSVHIPSADITRRVPAEFPNRNVRILVYCNTGQRARRAVELLRSLGYTNVVYIATSHRSIM